MLSFVRSLCFLTVVGLCALYVSPALAGSLKAADVEKFLGSMEGVNALAAKMESEGKKQVVEAEMEPAPGEPFKPLSKAVSVLKDEFPSDYKSLGKIVKKSGFSSQEDWANTGNTILVAYAASEMQSQGFNPAAMRAQFSPEMMAQMPPSMKPQMQKAMQMIEMFENIPAEDLVTIEPYRAEIKTTFHNK